MPITPINFTDAPAGWVPGDPRPAGATPVEAAALEGIQTNCGAYTDTQVAALDNASGRLRAARCGHQPFNGTTFPARPSFPLVIWVGGGRRTTRPRHERRRPLVPVGGLT
jgi:hypothetical protein